MLGKISRKGCAAITKCYNSTQNYTTMVTSYRHASDRPTATRSTNTIKAKLQRTRVRFAKPKCTTSLRDAFLSTNFDIFVIVLFMAFYNHGSKEVDAAENFSEEEPGGNGTGHSNSTSGSVFSSPTDELAPYAILFPWFVQIIAVFIYYVISRYLQSLPYTALVFILGFIIGYFTTGYGDNAISDSASLWLTINGQVILLVFLPGLIFLDSYTMNVHLFFQCFWQLINFAFPMVLGGTALTAVFAKYVLPYDWSWNLCMTFGAILAGTDPAAVSGLLTALGAPPRLSMHVSGESLLNDGSTVLLYQIFSSLYYYEFGIPHFGDNIGWGEGIKMFLQLAFGGASIGLAFGFGTVFVICLLNRRLSAEENVIQVVTTICSAYLAYFVAEILCNSSGIISTLVCGLTVKVFGETMINDWDLTLHFWQVTGQLLNTLLFALGGLLWGNIVSKNVYSQFETEDTDSLGAKDWGYLVLLYTYLIGARFVLVFTLYPVTSRIGIGSNLKEAIFMSYAGFRGAVGIALSLSLWANVFAATEHETVKFTSYRNDVVHLFGFVGGIALLTLLLNGITSGPLLFYLGLVTPPKTLLKVVENYRQQMIDNTLVAYVRLLSQDRFKQLDFSIVREHVPFLSNISFEQLMRAVEKHKHDTPSYLYDPPRLENVLPFLDGTGINSELADMSNQDRYEETHTRKAKSGRSSSTLASIDRSICFPTHVEQAPHDDVDGTQAERLNFIETLRYAYHQQIEQGELEEHGEVHYSLFQSLDFAEDAANACAPLNDWMGIQVASDTWVSFADKAFQTILRKLKNFHNCWNLGTWFDPGFFSVYLRVRQVLAFVRAHRVAQKIFKEQFSSVPLTPTEESVIFESNEQIKLAESSLSEIDQFDVDSVTLHFACHILLNISVKYTEKLAKQGLIPEKEASVLLQDLDSHIGNLLNCSQMDCKEVSISVERSLINDQEGSDDFSTPLLDS
ncbi:hypothetical protein HJC23_013154 [Cyclotella cryptica]|uniref:Cation/H+ exchanger transmembrane domain-containing protein n=1 Tax=Cyclotella cryptica TaxID=29204 RepID=A0ABD3QNA5_9STRA|eukprot:CCRYP_003974-RA/>CCRYP_003974-RA protein AED:0.09 eAED:0.09 QI:41/1/0.92/1/0.84/0.92/14/173/964